MFLSGGAVQHHRINLACHQRSHRQRAILETLRLLDILGHIHIARGAVLHADSLALQRFRAGNTRPIAHDNHLVSLHIAGREINLLLAVLCHRDTGSCHIALPCLHSGNHGIEGHILNHQLIAVAVGNLAHHIGIDTHDTVSLIELVRGEGRIGHHYQLAALVLLLATGSQKQSHERQHHCQPFLIQYTRHARGA